MLEVTSEEIAARLAEDNLWWTESGELEVRFRDLKKRDYLKPFCELVCDRSINRAVILMGPRRVGKTVMLHQLIHGLISEGFNPNRIAYIAIDTPTFTGMGLEKLVKLYADRNVLDLKKDDLYILFDEIQYLKNWEVHLKVLVDRFPNIRFVASGSAAAALKLKSQESGAGRFTDFMLPPLTFAEYLNFIGREEELLRASSSSNYQVKNIDELNKEFVNYINFGGYPEAVLSDTVRRDPARFLKNDIIDKVLLRDLPSLYGIEDVQELNSLFAVLAYNTSQELSLLELSKKSNVAAQTIKRYLEYLEAAFLITRVRRVDDHGKTFKRERGFKVYLTNPSMRSALYGVVGPDDSAMGALVETAIISQWFHYEKISSVHYARWKDGEVDIVVLDGVTLVSAREVKWSDRFYNSPGELKSLLVFAEKNKLSKASVTTRTIFGKKQVNGVHLNFVASAFHCYVLGKIVLESKFSVLPPDEMGEATPTP